MGLQQFCFTQIFAMIFDQSAMINLKHTHCSISLHFQYTYILILKIITPDTMQTLSQTAISKPHAITTRPNARRCVVVAAQSGPKSHTEKSNSRRYVAMVFLHDAFSSKYYFFQFES